MFQSLLNPILENRRATCARRAGGARKAQQRGLMKCDFPLHVTTGYYLLSPPGACKVATMSMTTTTTTQRRCRWQRPWRRPFHVFSTIFAVFYMLFHWFVHVLLTIFWCDFLSFLYIYSRLRRRLAYYDFSPLFFTDFLLNFQKCFDDF